MTTKTESNSVRQICDEYATAAALRKQRRNELEAERNRVGHDYRKQVDRHSELLALGEKDQSDLVQTQIRELAERGAAIKAELDGLNDTDLEQQRRDAYEEAVKAAQANREHIEGLNEQISEAREKLLALVKELGSCYRAYYDVDLHFLLKIGNGHMPARMWSVKPFGRAPSLADVSGLDAELQKAYGAKPRIRQEYYQHS